MLHTKKRTADHSKRVC